MVIRSSKLIELLEEFKRTNPNKETRIPYEEWRRLVNFLTNFKDSKLQVKIDDNALIITNPATDGPIRFHTKNHFIEFFRIHPITTILSSPKYECTLATDCIGLTFIIDDDGNRFAISNLDLELSDYHISDIERLENDKQAFGYTPIISDPMSGQSYFQNLEEVWEPITQWSTIDSSSDSIGCINGITSSISNSYLRINSYGDFEYCPPNDNETLSKGSSNKMNINLNNLFDFGPMNDGSVMYSPYGLAFRNSNGQYLTYNPTTKKTTDVTGLTLDLEGLIYKIPVGLSSVKPGDIIFHNGKPVCVESVENHSVICVDIENSELKTVIPPTNIFGFNYVTKITPIFNFGTANPTADNPFGNIMPYLLFSTLNENGTTNKNSGFDMQTLILMSMLSGNTDGNFFSNIFGNGQA